MSSANATTRNNPGQSWSFGTIVRYTLIAIVGYILAGAPLQTLLYSSTSSSSQSALSKARLRAERTRWNQSGRRHVQVSKEKLEGLVFPDRNLTCDQEHGFKGVYVLNREPLVVYVEGFLSAEECDHVVDIRYVCKFSISLTSIPLPLHVSKQ